MATATIPNLTINASPTAGEVLVTVRYQLNFDAFDRAADQPYLETVTLIGDDTAIGDPPAAGADDQLTLLGVSVVRASMNTGPTPFVIRSHQRSMPRTALNEDKAPIPNPDEIRALVTLTPQMPAALALQSNVVNLTITEPTENDTTVPDVVGDLGEIAYARIRAAGLVPSGGADNKRFEVLTQKPDADTVVNRGTTVSMTMKFVDDQ